MTQVPAERVTTSHFDAVRLGQQLRQMRLLTGYSLREAGEQSGIPFHVIGRLERGETDNPAFEPIVRLAATYGVSPNDVSALAGLWTTPELEETEDPALAVLLNRIRGYMARADTADERIYAMSILAHTLDTLDARIALRRDAEDVGASLPEWLARSIRNRVARHAQRDPDSD